MTRHKIIGLGLVLGMSVSMAANASTDRIDATYDFVWKGLRVSSAETQATFKDNSYQLAISFRMRGLARVFSSGHSEVISTGHLLDEGGVMSRHYSSTGHWDGEDYSRTMTFDESGKLQAMEQEWPEKWLEEFRYEPVPDDMQRGPDPASLAVALMRARLTEDTKGPDARIKTFDGETVLEWQLICSDAPVELKESRHSEFFGKAHECTVKTALLAGQRILSEKERAKLEKKRAKERKKAKRDGEEDTAPKFWLMAQGDAGYLVPVRAEMSTGMGRVSMYLKNFSIAGDEVTTAQSSR